MKVWRQFDANDQGKPALCRKSQRATFTRPDIDKTKRCRVYRERSNHLVEYFSRHRLVSGGCLRVTPFGFEFTSRQRTRGLNAKLAVQRTLATAFRDIGWIHLAASPPDIHRD